jgi:tetratricopeptide (TPR) repeat protein
MFRRSIVVLTISALALFATGCNEAKKYKARGMEKMQARQYGDAIHEFDRAIRADDADAELYYYRAYAWLSLQDAQQALRDVERTLQIKPQHSEARILRGYAHLELGNLDLALADLDEAVRLLPDNAQAYQTRGMTRMARGDYTKALADFEKAISLDPRQSQGYNNRAWLRATARDATFRDGKQAVADATTASDLLNENEAKYACLDTLAAAHAEAGEFEKAAEIQQQAIDHAPPTGIASMKSRLELYKSRKPYHLAEGKFH